MKLRDAQHEQARRAILDALANVIVESGGIGFSVQEVADRAGLTHRTVYNYFPTRDALSEGLAVHVEEQLSTLGPPPDATLSLEGLVPTVREVYRAFEAREILVRAYVMLTVASRGPTKVARDRTSAFEALIERQAAPRRPMTARQVTAAVRMFLSSTGWHLLTEHLRLSTEEAAATATWATQTLLDAVKKKGRSKGGAK